MREILVGPRHLSVSNFLINNIAEVSAHSHENQRTTGILILFRFAHSHGLVGLNLPRVVRALSCAGRQFNYRRAAMPAKEYSMLIELWANRAKVSLYLNLSAIPKAMRQQNRHLKNWRERVSSLHWEKTFLSVQSSYKCSRYKCFADY